MNPKPLLPSTLTQTSLSHLTKELPLKMLAENFYPSLEVWTTKEDLEWLMLLESQSPQAMKARELELAECKKNPWRWLTHWVKTEDAQNKEQPFQPFPNDLHLQVMTHFWVNEQNLLIPKSRQMTATWLISSLYLWESLFFPSRLTIFQSKNEVDSDANLERVKTMWEQLPWWQRDWQPMSKTYCNMKFPKSRSEIIAVPEGSKHFRQRTLSGVFIDEAAFTEELADVVAACASALGKIGKLTMISSATPSYFGELVFNRAS